MYNDGGVGNLLVFRDVAIVICLVLRRHHDYS